MLSKLSALPADVSAKFIATSMLSMLSIAESEHVLNLVWRIQIVRKLQKMIHEASYITMCFLCSPLQIDKVAKSLVIWRIWIVRKLQKMIIREACTWLIVWSLRERAEKRALSQVVHCDKNKNGSMLHFLPLCKWRSHRCENHALQKTPTDHAFR